MLQNTKSGLLKRLARFFTGALSDDFYDELEEEMCIRDSGICCLCNLTSSYATDLRET